MATFGCDTDQTCQYDLLADPRDFDAQWRIPEKLEEGRIKEMPNAKHTRFLLLLTRFCFVTMILPGIVGITVYQVCQASQHQHLHTHTKPKRDYK